MTTDHTPIRAALAGPVTPGEWREGIGFDIEAVGGWPVAEVVRINGHAETMEANRRFIAAANPAAVRALLADLDRMREALAEYVYETTHLSPMEVDGSHWCRIPAETLARARSALSQGTSNDR